ncbi:membrane lipoprotein [Francisella frigiditurris]|uniref:Putative membrane protein n=1 Tax=Francisella frigiditurris TaxID=1542390 RepID=A0A1J0KSJ1_9GAMM|nr:membrane lipoprotein [Francisella frigiditurris]APC96687.1 putative membrane protein [Francisella frigiditurris]
MQKYLNKVFIAYMAGLVSALVIELLWILATTHNLNLTEELKFEIYRMMIWGGVWATLFALPISKNIWVKSTIIALIVILFNYMIRMPYSGDGFFASNADSGLFYANIIFNFPWAFLAGFIYDKTIERV